MVLGERALHKRAPVPALSVDLHRRARGSAHLRFDVFHPPAQNPNGVLQERRDGAEGA